MGQRRHSITTQSKLPEAAPTREQLDTDGDQKREQED